MLFLTRLLLQWHCWLSTSSWQILSSWWIKCCKYESIWYPLLCLQSEGRSTHAWTGSIHGGLVSHFFVHVGMVMWWFHYYVGKSRCQYNLHGLFMHIRVVFHILSSLPWLVAILIVKIISIFILYWLYWSNWDHFFILANWKWSSSNWEYNHSSSKGHEPSAWSEFLSLFLIIKTLKYKNSIFAKFCTSEF